MNDLYDFYQQKISMGQRFKKFRELLGKTRKQMEQEANNPLIQVTRIYMFEQGAIIPDIVFIQYFTETYRLNLTWLVTGTGKTFNKKTEDRRQRTDDRRQRTDDRRQRTDDRRKMTDDRRQKTDDRRQRTEDRCRMTS